MILSDFWHKFSKLFSVVTLKMRSRSPNPSRLSIIPSCCILANFDKIRSPNQEILYIYQRATATLLLTLTPTPSWPATSESPLLSGKMNRTITYFPFLIQTFDENTLNWLFPAKQAHFMLILYPKICLKRF